MSQITKLGEGKNKRASVYVDEQFVCFLNQFTVFKYKLKVGQEISIETLKKIQVETEEDTAFDIAIKYLTKYTKTEKELCKFLQRKGFVDEVVDLVLKKLKCYNYIDDRVFASNFVKMAQNKFGKNKIKMILKQKGISDDIINEINMDSNTEIIEALVLKYMKNKDNSSQNRQKCAKFLYSRGFCWGEISSVLDSFSWEGESESWE